MSSGRRDLLVAALVVSAIVHVALMFYAKPQVMTTVAAGVARATRRGPMKVTETAPAPDPVRIEVVRDEAAKKVAPAVTETVALVPAEAATLPVPSAKAESVKAELPEVLSCLRPDEVAPALAEARPEAKPVEAVEMPVETPMPVVRDDDTLKVGDITQVSAASAPVFEAPVFSGTAPAVMVREIRPAPRPKPPKPAPVVTEVMETVDEKVVEAEKAAVRELMEESSALDMTASVAASLACCRRADRTYFRLTFAPKTRLPSVPKDFVILLDASGSIGEDRLASCRKAARRILRSATNTGDRFNLVAFRDRFNYAFRTWQDCDAAGFGAADKWLSNLASHGRTDVFATISSVLTLPREATRPLVALVVTDAQANEGVKENAEMLQQFAALNDGLISVYMYGVKSAANVELIDLLTRSNRGESFVYDGWRWSAGEGIDALSERFRDPLVTDFRLLFSADTPAEAYPTVLKNLYRGNTVTVLGSVPSGTESIRFSLRGLAGSSVYEGFYDLPLGTAARDDSVYADFTSERDLASRL